MGPNQRLTPSRKVLGYSPKRGPSRRAHAAARVHHTARWRGGRMAAKGACAAGGAIDRVIPDAPMGSPMLRRDFLCSLVGALVAGRRVAIARTPSNVYRVGRLFPGPPLDEKSPRRASLLKKLELHGYTLGKNLAFEARGAGG